MHDQTDHNPTEEETISRMQAAYDEFVAKLEELRKERLDLAKKVVARIEERKISEVLKSLKE